jgi:hypothetical protein
VGEGERAKCEQREEFDQGAGNNINNQRESHTSAVQFSSTHPSLPAGPTHLFRPVQTFQVILLLRDTVLRGVGLGVALRGVSGAVMRNRKAKASLASDCRPCRPPQRPSDESLLTFENSCQKGKHRVRPALSVRLSPSVSESSNTTHRPN